jgi:hypothetical protein
MNATTAIRAKKIRTYIIEHPGCTKDEIYAAHPDEKLVGGFEPLQRHRLIRQEGGGKLGPAKWYPKEASPRNSEPVKPDDHT